MADLHYVLGVDKDAGEAEIKKAFRKIALECHPDRSASSNMVIFVQGCHTQIWIKSCSSAGWQHLPQITRPGLLSDSRLPKRLMKGSWMVRWPIGPVSYRICIAKFCYLE